MSKMSIQARTVSGSGELSTVALDDGMYVISIVVMIDGAQYEISQRDGQLRLAALEGTLQIQPLGANAVTVGAVR